MKYEDEPLIRVLRAAREVLPQDHIWQWMGTEHPQLGGCAPISAIHAGDGERVLDLIASMADGVPT